MYKNQYVKYFDEEKIFEINKIDIFIISIQQNFIINILRDVFY